MKIFLSWSQERSRRIAEFLNGWLPDVIQALQPWFSTDDVGKGTRSLQQIGKALESMTFGIMCLTPENQRDPWINYEAGALAKEVEESRIYTLIYEMKPADVVGPLSQFQHTIFDRADVFRLVAALNGAAGDARLDDVRLTKAFDRSWPELERFIATLPAAPSAPPTRTSDSMAAETLETVRGLQAEFESLSVTVSNLEVQSEGFLTVGPAPLRRDVVPGHPIDDPIGFIKLNYGDKTTRELARATGLSEHTIRRKVDELGLSRKAPPPTKQE